MGAVLGGGVLTRRAARQSDEPGAPEGWFDVERYRHAGRRVVFRTVDRPVLVLGSAQRQDVVDRARAATTGVVVTRRRGGGGAVLLTPGAQVWADMWVPSTDPLWAPEPQRTAVQVGQWWAAALVRAGIRAAVHDGSSTRTRFGDLVCFAGLGPGEVCTGGRKVVGLAQWRSREGALVFGCAYRRFDPEPLVDCLTMDQAPAVALTDALGDSVTDLARLGLATWGPEDLVAELPAGAEWDVVRS